jgi:DNA-binding transcriptional LysR family regulator
MTDSFVQYCCMHLNPERLLILQAVDDAGGVLAAGRRLHLAPSGISQHIAALERETGLVLLDRSRRGGQRPAQLTAAGRLLVTHAARLANLIAEAETDIQALAGQVDGPIVLAAFPTVIARLVVPALVELADTNRGITPMVREIDEQAAVAALHAGDVDLVLVEDDIAHPRTPDPGCAMRWLMDDPYRVAIPTSWTTPISLEDLCERPWVDGPSGSAISQALDRLRNAAGLSLPAAHICLEYPAALALVAGGMAAALVPDLALTYPLPAHVRIVNLADLGARRISSLYRTRRDQPAPVVTALLDALTTAAYPST